MQVRGWVHLSGQHLPSKAHSPEFQSWYHQKKKRKKAQVRCTQVHFRTSEMSPHRRSGHCLPHVFEAHSYQVHVYTGSDSPVLGKLSSIVKGHSMLGGFSAAPGKSGFDSELKIYGRCGFHSLRSLARLSLAAFQRHGLPRRPCSGSSLSRGTFPGARVGLG